MDVDITLKNYRCFPDSKPVRISIGKGFTAFVGVNNSGKSSLLKFFYEFRDLFSKLAQSSTLHAALMRSERIIDFTSSVKDIAEVFCNANDRNIDIEVEFIFTDRGVPRVRIPVRFVVTVRRNSNRWSAQLHLSDHPVPAENLHFKGNVLYHGSNPQVDLEDFFQMSRILSRALYVGAFRNAINIGSNEDYFDIQVGQAFVQAWREYKTGNNKRNNEAAIRLTKDIQDIFGFNELEINPSSDDQTFQVNVDGRSYRLTELGSGLAQFIIVLANAAVRRPSYILIDEPELNLHPSLQLDFLTTLASYASDGILFATHSIGLARACADQVYSVRITDGGSEVTPYEATPRLSEFLGELSFSGYRELEFEQVLLVEGSTDVKNIQQFLRMHKKDHQIVLLPLGGGDLIKESCETELRAIKRITDNVCALIDSERDSPDTPLSPEREAFVETCKRVGIECHVLERRAIENYFSDRAVKQVKGEKYRALGNYELLKDAPLGWSKAENWRMARAMTLDELEETDLGEFLAAI